MNDPPLTRYAMQDDMESQRVQFAPLVMIIEDYDTPHPAITHRQDERFTYDIYARPTRTFPRHHHPASSTAATMQPPQAHPLMRTGQQATTDNQLTNGNQPMPIITGHLRPTQPTLTIPTTQTAPTNLGRAPQPPGVTPTNMPLPPLPPPPTQGPPAPPPCPPPHAVIPLAEPTALETETTITITTYNVISARGTRLLQALRAMDDIKTDIALLTETKLCRGRHTRKGFGYTVMATDAPSHSKGGVALAWRTTANHWSLEGVRPLSPNSISATLVSGTQRWLLLGTYLTPNASPDAELDILAAEYRRNPRLPVILVGDLNADIDNMEDERSITIATATAQLGTTDIFHLFPQKNKRRFTRHKIMRNGTHQRTRCDYALVDADVPVQSLRLIIPPRFHSDHWAIKLQIRSSGARVHNRYIHNRTQLPRVPALPGEGGPNCLFNELLSLHNRPQPIGYPARDNWIAMDTWSLIDQCNSALKRLAQQDEL